MSNTTVEQPANVVVVDEESVTVLVQDTSFTVTLADVGPQGVQGLKGDKGDPGEDKKAYVHNQNTPSALWTITHNLNSYPAVTVIDSAGGNVVGDVNYVSSNQITITFSGSFSGQAFLN